MDGQVDMKPRPGAAAVAGGDARGERQQDVGVPGVVQVQPFVLLDVAVGDVHPAAWTPSSSHGNSARPAPRVGSRATTGAPLVPRCIRASVRK